jgi:putative DNA primase/helicase
MNADQKYYENVLRAGSGIITIMVLRKDGGKGIFHCRDADEIRQCLEKNRDNSNIYVSLNPFRADIPSGLKGGDDDVVGLNAIVADCDIFGLAHAEKNLPKDAKAVQELLEAFPKPTYYIDSGYGLYAVWAFKETIPMEAETDRQAVFGIYRGLGRALISAFAEKGYKLDNVFCPSHLFRIPCSLNFKLNNPVECRVTEYSGIFYTLDDFRQYYEEPVQKHEPFEVDDRCVGSADRIAEHCAFIRKLQDDPESVTEPEWKAMCDNIVLAEDGQEKFHDWSSLYSNYTYEETEYKIRRSLTAKKPCTCKYIHEHLGFECPEGGCGVKAPVVFSLYTKQEQLQRLLEDKDFTESDVYDPYVLSLASYAKENAPAEYGRLKLAVKKVGVGLRDFERAVRCESDRQTEPEFDIEPTEIKLEGIDLHGAMEPKNYRISMADGITVLWYQDGTLNANCLCHEPMVITRRLENIDSGQEKLVIAHYRNNRWKEIISPRSVALNKNRLIGLSDSGLPVSSSNAEGVVKFLTAYEAANSKHIPFTRSIDRIGWIGKEFYPCRTNSEVVYEGDDADNVISSITEHGDYGLWLKTAVELRKEPLSRVLLAASFASPLLEPLKNRVIILHLWYASKSGKTAGLKFSLSVWGDPLKLMGNYNTTAVGLERRAGTLKHLPLGIDELQSLNEKRLSPSLVVYSLGNGYGKTRGAKNGGLQDVPTWRNCIISTGEQPLAPENAMDGVNSRVLELYGSPVSSPEAGRKIHQISESNYGFAGRRYIDFIVNTILTNKDKIRQDYENIREKLQGNFDGDPGAHLDNVAVLALADCYSSVCLFDMGWEDAVAEAVSLGDTVLRNAKSLEKEDVVERAWLFLEDWVASNRKRFCADSIPCYGTIEGDGVYIICNVFRQALEDAGFSYTKSIKGFRDRGYIRTIVDADGNERSQHQKKIQGVNVRAILAKISVQQTDDPEDDFLKDPAELFSLK